MVISDVMGNVNYMTKFDKFTQAIKEAWEEFNDEGDNDFLLVVVEHKEDDMVGAVGITGFGCPACCSDVLHAMVQIGQISHQTGEKVH